MGGVCLAVHASCRLGRGLYFEDYQCMWILSLSTGTFPTISYFYVSDCARQRIKDVGNDENEWNENAPLLGHHLHLLLSHHHLYQYHIHARGYFLFRTRFFHLNQSWSTHHNFAWLGTVTDISFYFLFSVYW